MRRHPSSVVAGRRSAVAALQAGGHGFDSRTLQRRKALETGPFLLAATCALSNLLVHGTRFGTVGFPDRVAPTALRARLFTVLTTLASTEKRLKDRELLLVVADAAGGTLDGRTVAQKLLYFAGCQEEAWYLPAVLQTYFLGFGGTRGRSGEAPSRFQARSRRAGRSGPSRPVEALVRSRARAGARSRSGTDSPGGHSGGTSPRRGSPRRSRARTGARARPPRSGRRPAAARQ